MSDRAPPLKNREQESRLFWRLVHGELSSEEFAQLDERLLADPELRQRYLLYMTLESNLPKGLEYLQCDSFSVGTEFPSPLPTRNTTLFAGRTARLTLIAGCLAGVVAAVSLLMLRPVRHEGTDPSAAAKQADDRQSAMASSANTFRQSDVQGAEDAAIVTEIDDVAGGGSLKVGQRLKPGSLHVSAGALRLDFLSGAQVLLQAPAELLLISRDAATLIEGRAAARVPPQAKGFMLSTPDAAVVDLGTEFSLSVGRNGESEVYVAEGEVEVSLLGDDGSTLESESVLEAHTLRVALNPSALQPIPRPTVDLPRFGARHVDPLPVSESYVQAILQSQPVLYWRFESVRDGMVPNEVGAGLSGRVLDESTGAPALAITQGYARFEESEQCRYIDLGADQGMPEINAGAYSIELWVNPDRMQWCALAGLRQMHLSDDNQLTIIEVAHQTRFSHAPAAFRFLHRYPTGRRDAAGRIDPNGKRGGINLFSPRGCTPGQWHHLVTVKTLQELQLFVNGELVRTIETASVGEDAPYSLLLGQLWDGSTVRQFVGGMDEFAVYKRALTAEEVRRHYTLMLR